MLNGQNQDIAVNYLELEQFDTEGKGAYFSSWITDIAISEENIVELTLIGRSRWKIENSLPVYELSGKPLTLLRTRAIT